MDPNDPNQILAFLASQRGQNLGASDWNDTRQLYANAFNSRQGYTQGGYGASLGVGQGQAGVPSINVATGTGEVQKIPFTPDVQDAASALQNQYFARPQAPVGYGMMGNQPVIGGQSAPHGWQQDAASFGFTPLDYAQQAARTMTANNQAAFNPITARQQMQQDPRYLAIPGYQQQAASLYATGQDDRSFAAQQQIAAKSHMDMALQLQAARIAEQKGNQESYDAMSRNLGGPDATPEELRTTYDPVNHYATLPGKTVSDIASPGGYKTLPPRQVFIQPGDFNALLAAGQKLGYEPTSSGQQLAQMHAERDQLEAQQAQKAAESAAQRRAALSGIPRSQPDMASTSTAGTIANALYGKQTNATLHNFGADMDSSFLNAGNGIDNLFRAGVNILPGLFGSQNNWLQYHTPARPGRFDPQSRQFVGAKPAGWSGTF